MSDTQKQIDELKGDCDHFVRRIKELCAENLQLERERNSWKKAHDNQVKLKQIISDRPNLKERAKLVAELIEERDECKRLAIEQHHHIKELDIDDENHYQLITKLIEERDQVIRNYDMLKKLYDATALDRRNCVQTAVNLTGQNHELIEERDGWREAAYSLGEAIPASWESLQPPAAQLAKFKEMVKLQQEK